MYYYAMSIPEILVLMFILSLWVLSIFCCFRRYEKINTIERADMPSSALLTANNYPRKASVGTTASLVSLKNGNQGNSNPIGVLASVYTGEPKESIVSENPLLLAYSDGWSSRIRFSDVVCLSSNQRRRVSGPDSYNYFSEVTSSNEKNPATKGNRYFKQHNMARQAKRYQHNILRKEERTDNEFQIMMNYPLLGAQMAVMKSSSVPNFKPSGEQDKAVELERNTSTEIKEPIVTSIAIPEQDERQRTRKKSEALLDPSQIPLSVRKNLLGLHQKSMLNLSNKQSNSALNEEPGSSFNNQFLSSNYQSGRNNLLKKYTKNQASLYDLTKTSLRV